jgi:diguanylate cyclase (GGDEF)-like protein
MWLPRLMRADKIVKVLLIEDDTVRAAHVKRALKKAPDGPVSVTIAGVLEHGLHHLEVAAVDLVVLDLACGDEAGVDVVRQVRRMAPTIPIIVIADESDEALAIQALQRDAQDYVLSHQLNPVTLARALRHALEPDRWKGQYRRLLGVSPDGVVIVDADGRVLFVNAAAARILGGAPTWSAELPEAMQEGAAEATDIVTDQGRVAEVREVDTMWYGRSARLITMRDITDRIAAERRVAHMSEELRRANERLEALVDSDALTHVLNRRGVEAALGLELRRMGRSGDGLMAILVDCDDFKLVNDAFGYGVGDAALVALAKSVQGAVRAGDHVARVGGDEFLVLLPGTTVAEGMVVAEKVRRAVKATTLPLSANGLTLSASLAVGPVSPDAVSVEEVLASLHDRLRQSKRAGKNLVTGDPSSGIARGRGPRSAPLTSSTLDPTSIALHVVVQGIQRLEDDAPIGCEALMRGPPGDFAMPSDLFQVAFEQNVLTALDLRALRVSMESFGRSTWDGWYHVNLFPSTLLNTSADRIIPLLERGGRREHVCVELSEQQFLGDPAYLRPMVRELRSAGYRVGIDDVGFGRSSVEALMLLEPDVVKVDRRCIRAIGEAGERRQLERLLAMLRAVEATIIVEGVETREEKRLLREMGVPFGQGYLWGKPARSVGAAPGFARRPAARWGVRDVV